MVRRVSLKNQEITSSLERNEVTKDTLQPRLTAGLRLVLTGLL